jgi:hypothetical protein
MNDFLSGFKRKPIDATDELKELLGVYQEQLDGIDTAIDNCEGMLHHMRNFVGLHEAKKKLETKIATIEYKLPEEE